LILKKTEFCTTPSLTTQYRLHRSAPLPPNKIIRQGKKKILQEEKKMLYTTLLSHLANVSMAIGCWINPYFKKNKRFKGY
jgi:hypothetical protein